MIIPFIDVDPDRPPKCTICNDYGGYLDDDYPDSDGFLCECVFGLEEDLC
jgi:hypothetical protein